MKERINESRGLARLVNRLLSKEVSNRDHNKSKKTNYRNFSPGIAPTTKKDIQNYCKGKNIDYDPQRLWRIAKTVMNTKISLVPSNQRYRKKLEELESNPNYFALDKTPSQSKTVSQDRPLSYQY